MRSALPLFTVQTTIGLLDLIAIVSTPPTIKLWGIVQDSQALLFAPQLASVGVNHLLAPLVPYSSALALEHNCKRRRHLSRWNILRTIK